VYNLLLHCKVGLWFYGKKKKSTSIWRNVERLIRRSSGVIGLMPALG
jgi:hypothetical protein